MGAAGQGAETYIDLSDFTGGIVSSWHSNGGAQAVNEDPDAPKIYAQRDLTWGCYGHPLGGLAPLPGIVDEVLEDTDDWAAAAKFPGSTRAYVVNGTGILSPTAAPTMDVADGHLSSENCHPETPDQLYVVYGGWGGNDSIVNTGLNDTTAWFGATELKVFARGGLTRTNTRFMGGHAEADNDQRFADLRYISKTTEATTALDASIAAVISRGMTPVHVFPATSGVTDDGSGGAVGTAADMGYVVMAVVAGRVGWYPGNIRTDPVSDTERLDMVNVENDSAQDMQLWWGLMHQRQIVFTSSRRIPTELTLQLGSSVGFMTSSTVSDDDHIGWFEVNDLHSAPSPEQLRFMPESPVGYGAVAVMNANELFMVKHAGGALVVRGDVTSPQVINLTGVPSTHGASNIPVTTPIGVIYGTRDGAWLWNGGEEAEPISPLLDGCFWRPEDQPGLEYGHPATPRGKFNFSHPFLFAPNNWVMDIRTRAWFRLQPSNTENETGFNTPRPVVYRNYEVSANSKVYAVKSIVTESNLVVAHLYDHETPAPEYRFHSQPIKRTLNRKLKFREVVLTAQGEGTVTVKLQTNSDSATVSFAIDNPDRPKIYRQPVGVKGEDLEVIIWSRAANLGTPGGGGPEEGTDTIYHAQAGNPAPSVYRVSVGYRGDSSVPVET